MNKRIQNKVTKRIINKMKLRKSLTEFEKSYFDKYLLNSFSAIATEFLESFLSILSETVEAQLKITEEETVIDQTPLADEEPKNFEATVGGWTYSSKSFPTEEQFTDVVNLIATPEEPILYETSKWQKVKGKVKGWFGK